MNRDLYLLIAGMCLSACLIFIYLDRFVPVVQIFSDVSRLETELIRLKEEVSEARSVVQDSIKSHGKQIRLNRNIIHSERSFSKNVYP